MASTYSISRTTVVDAPASAVYDRVADLHRWREWSPWEGLDADLQRDYSGAEQGVGARYAWSGNRKAGRGTMEVVAAEPTSAVDVAVTFEKPYKSTSTSRFRLEPDGSSTRVTWTMVGPQSLFSRLGLLDRMMGKDFEKGLAQLKTAAESG
ncbi:SRPBCC family protein [Gordonia sp. (in: high G+C Gram-positive bacteria)]|uniref:SRPBCC family protein n=1 Tax=Gordonia sp. (in: high G+C Gram-positive bacteria) TaxID=84139 RepID=UPI0039E40AC4